jgi:predicted transcriptional regulator of viral defense system
MYDMGATEHGFAELFGAASEQAGYFTSAQAHACGYSKQLLAYHAATGRFVRIRRGLYRLRDYPSSPHEDVMAAWLATGRDTSLVSHESALDLLDLSDVVPSSIHLLISRTRRGLLGLPGVTLHTTVHAVRPNEVTVREGMRLTAPARTIIDVAELGTAPEQVIMAIAQARDRGWITASELRAAAQYRDSRVTSLIDKGLEEDGT